MKLAVFSDSHGETYYMIRAVTAFCPDMIIHLGDYTRDAAVLKAAFPDTPFKAVRGNCDFGASEPVNQLFSVGPVTVFMTHGHNYNVKYGLDSLLNAGHFSGAGLVLFGHTHKALITEAAGMRVVNPGAMGHSRRPTWARIEISDAGLITAEIVEAGV